MENLKVVAVANHLESSTAYGQQMRMLLEEFPTFDWHYLPLDMRESVQRRMTFVGSLGQDITLTTYPTGGDEIHIAENTFTVADTVKPDFVFLYEDVQWLNEYAKRRSKWPRISWFPWDNDNWTPTIEEFMHNADIPVCLSEDTRNLCADHGFDIDRIYNYVDDAAFKPVKKDKVDDFKEKFLGIPPDKHVLLYVGRMTARKNPEILFALARELKKVRKDFVLLIHSDAADPGRTCDPLMEILCHDVADVVKFSPNVEWSNLPPKEHLNMVYNSADIFVSGHGGEGFGVPACEAGLCEKPFIMTDCTTTKEFGGNGIHGFGAPIMASKTVLNIQRPIPDYKKMAELSCIMLDDEMLRFKMGTSFRKWVLENCRREVVSDQWTKIFEKCLVKKVTVKNANNDG